MMRAGEFVYEFGKFRLDPQERLLTLDDCAVSLSPKAFDVLLLLVDRSGHLVTKDELLNKIWKDNFVEEVNLSVQISALRKALKRAGGEAVFIETVPKKGYRFVADVRESAESVLLAQRFRLSAVTEEIESNGIVSESDAAALSENVANRSYHRTRTIAAAAMAIVALGIATAIYFSVRWRVAASAPDFTSYSLQRLTAGEKTGYVVISPDGEFIIFGEKADKGWSFKMRRLGDDTSVTVVPEFETACWGITISHDNNYFYYVLADLPPSRTDQGTLYRVSVLGGQPRKVLEGINSAPTLSPDDTRVGFMRYPRADVAHLITANAVDGTDERLVETSENQPQIWNPIWSPDGKQFTGFTKEQRPDGNYYRMVNLSVSGGNIEPLTKPSKQYIWWHTWLNDQSGLVAIQTDPITSLRQVVFVSYPDGAIRKITNDMNQYAGISASSDGNKIVIGESWRDSSIAVSPVNEPRRAVEIPIHACCPDTATWTADGHLIYDAVENGKRSLWRILPDGSEEERLSSGDAQDWSPSATNDGKFLVFLSSRSGTKQIWRSDLSGRDAVQLTNEDLDISSPRVSPDSSTIYFGEYTDGKWKIATVSIDGGAGKIVVDEPSEVWAVSPDGRSIAYTFWDDNVNRGRVAIRSLIDGTITRILDITPDGSLQWTADSRSLVYQDEVTRNDSSSALWKTDVNAHTPVQITEAGLRYFDISRSFDGSQFAFVRGKVLNGSAILQREPR